MNHESLDNKLQKAIPFTKDDLSLNRQGKLSPSQIEKLKHGMFDPSKWSKFILGLMVGGLVLVVFRDGLQVLNLQFILAYVGFCVVFYFLYNLYFKRNAKKLEEGKYAVEALEGLVTVSADNKSQITTSMNQYGTAINMGERFSGISLNENAYVVQVGEKRIYTTKAIQEAFENGKKYKVYLLKTSQQEYKNILYGAVIVSAEVF